jgi:hypothetical protein
LRSSSIATSGSATVFVLVMVTACEYVDWDILNNAREI